MINTIHTLNIGHFNKLTTSLQQDSIENNIQYILKIKTQFKININDLLHHYFIYIFNNHQTIISNKTIEFMEHVTRLRLDSESVTWKPEMMSGWYTQSLVMIKNPGLLGMYCQLMILHPTATN